MESQVYLCTNLFSALFHYAIYPSLYPKIGIIQCEIMYSYIIVLRLTAKGCFANFYSN